MRSVEQPRGHVLAAVDDVDYVLAVCVVVEGDEHEFAVAVAVYVAHAGGRPPQRSGADSDGGPIGDGGYFAWRQVLGAAMRHSGVVRIDHAMGMTRQYWVPHGRPAAEGCYVRYPLRDLMGVVALMSRRHQCLVVGEDLGTVPAGFGSTLARAGVLSSRVLLFERDRAGDFYPASQYSKRALVTANTHDHATLTGYVGGRDLELRRELGLLEASDFDAAVAERQRDLTQLRQRLRLAEDVTPGDLTAAVHAFLGRTPAPLVGISLDDLAGETEPVNIPGVPPERFPSWTRRMGTPLCELAHGEHTAQLDRLRSRGPLEAGEHVTGSDA